MTNLPAAADSDISHSQRIMLSFTEAAQIETALAPLIEPAEKSRLWLDDERAPVYTVSAYAFNQMNVATGCIASLEQMMVRETERKVSLTANPFGAYALVRGAIDAAATALWLLEPESGTLRIKRRIQLARDEAEKKESFLETMEKRSDKDERKARLKDASEHARLGSWNPEQHKLPSMTRILQQLERLHDGSANFPWLAAWQLSSGHTHGKQWAQISSHVVQELDGTRTELGGAHAQLGLHYGLFALVLSEAVQMLEEAAVRYVVLAGGPPRT
ncbi:hypothetical protein ACIQTZ_19750 [Paenarthrobacter sp. NPDC090520]|uniref:hypothetical protein n=1 Tax=Paenarthrobacter sp. NPDC090520 TaxID=3364382 RepID=UPI0038082031